MAQTVLILDDEPDNVSLIDVALRRHLDGVETVLFDAPTVAACWCSQHEPDLCLIDYRMPDMTGIDFIRQVRELLHFRSVPMIMITGQPDPCLQYAALEAGATDFLCKPYNTRDVVVRTRNHLRLRENLRARCCVAAPAATASAPQRVERNELQIIDRLARLSGYRGD